MGTNFYWKPNDKGMLPCGLGPWSEDTTSPRIHIGKRSAAGLYCYDCGVPLVEEVTVVEHERTCTKRWCSEAIHGGYAKRPESCPLCGKEWIRSNRVSSAEVELGLGKPDLSRPTGVESAASFSWAQEPARVISTCMLYRGLTLVYDEYGTLYTGSSFLANVLAAPIWFTTSIGEPFF